MAPAADLRTTYDPHLSPRARALALAGSFVFVLLFVWALIRVGALPGVNGRAEQSPLLVFTPATESRNASAAPRAATRTRQQTRQQNPQRTPPTPPPPTPTPPPEITIDLPGFIHLTRPEYAKSDIGRMPRRAADAAAAAAGSEVAGDDSGDSPSVAGAAPGGEPLYAAEWYREPRPAETQPYMPAGVEGWGMVACKTIDRYHVEDCRELGETPGSGIARGLRQAAWQFLVRPPRKGGKPLIGAWVRIRFDLIRHEARGS